MDPLTHGLIGAAVSTFSGTTAAIDNPLMIGAALGAMSPDLDFVIRIFKNDAEYMKHHRGHSHTVPFLAVFSLAITAGLSFFTFNAFDFLTVFFWTFLGALSHTLMDILNSYGSKLFSKKRKLSLLTLYDPFISLVGLWLILTGEKNTFELVGAAITVLLYLTLRHINKTNAAHELLNYFSREHHSIEVSVYPSLRSFYKWDFVAHTETHDYVGQYNPWMSLMSKDAIRFIQTFKREDHEVISTFNASNVGAIFGEFSPNLHIRIETNDEDDLIILRAIDLRYFMKDRFMHHATLVLDAQFNIVSSYLHPYRLKNAIPVY